MDGHCMLHMRSNVLFVVQDLFSYMKSKALLLQRVPIMITFFRHIYTFISYTKWCNNTRGAVVFGFPLVLPSFIFSFRLFQTNTIEREDSSFVPLPSLSLSLFTLLSLLLFKSYTSVNQHGTRKTITFSATYTLYGTNNASISLVEIRWS